ncbi:MAG TPA: LON peptidase substrate-binding domain-containing protein [Rhizomicrobium sp.]|jgi:Lon protease-like protein|nr:LON peptidase substrate-binding domain-containing protein [Rhizomicrobium sp.]
MSRRYHAYSDLPHSLPLFPLTGAVLLPRGQLPLNIFEPRYLEMVEYALQGDRLIGMIQPVENEETTLKPRLSQVGCAGKITAFQETADNRYLITLAGVCRFRLTGEMQSATAWRAGFCDFAAFAGDLAESAGGGELPRERLLHALKTYLTSRDMQADWNSVLTAPAEALVNALAMMCPFAPAEKQALLEAPGFHERASTLLALLEMGAEAGPTTLN